MFHVSACFPPRRPPERQSRQRLLIIPAYRPWTAMRAARRPKPPPSPPLSATRRRFSRRGQTGQSARAGQPGSGPCPCAWTRAFRYRPARARLSHRWRFRRPADDPGAQWPVESGAHALGPGHAGRRYPGSPTESDLPRRMEPGLGHAQHGRHDALPVLIRTTSRVNARPWRDPAPRQLTQAECLTGLRAGQPGLLPKPSTCPPGRSDSLDPPVNGDRRQAENCGCFTSPHLDVSCLPATLRLRSCATLCRPCHGPASCSPASLWPPAVVEGVVEAQEKAAAARPQAATCPSAMTMPMTAATTNPSCRPAWPSPSRWRRLLRRPQ